MAGSHVGYAALYKAIRIGDWDAVNEFLQHQPNTLSGEITATSDSALRIAVDAGNLSIVEKLVQLMHEEDLEIRDNSGDTALHMAAVYGKYRMAECMVSKNTKLFTTGNSSGSLPVPVNLAISFGHMKLARYLYCLTPPEYLMPERGDNGGDIFVEKIYTGTLGKTARTILFPV
ncbi:hypothetical protein CJ030_MR1G015674 [Morella rubra]|uniref:Uncharacterized protein n=1 Tax=Morella rubra TaxID=262757 RepID=A0A6A1WLJ9_9ROSI|nr:hypothetical protein CJ030_MR1G015674 [Morella rubra]